MSWSWNVVFFKGHNSGFKSGVSCGQRASSHHAQWKHAPCAAHSGVTQDGRVQIERETFHNMSAWMHAPPQLINCWPAVNHPRSYFNRILCEIEWNQPWSWPAVSTATAQSASPPNKALIETHILWTRAFFEIRAPSYCDFLFCRPWLMWSGTQKRSEEPSFTTSRGLRRPSVATSTPR